MSHILNFLSFFSSERFLFRSRWYRCFFSIFSSERFLYLSRAFLIFFFLFFRKILVSFTCFFRSFCLFSFFWIKFVNQFYICMHKNHNKFLIVIYHFFIYPANIFHRLQNVTFCYMDHLNWFLWITQKII